MPTNDVANQVCYCVAWNSIYVWPLGQVIDEYHRILVPKSRAGKLNDICAFLVKLAINMDTGQWRVHCSACRLGIAGQAGSSPFDDIIPPVMVTTHCGPSCQSGEHQWCHVIKQSLSPVRRGNGMHVYSLTPLSTECT